MVAPEDPMTTWSRLQRGDRRALARLLTLAESDGPAWAGIADAVATAATARSRRALRIGVTGAGGVGKSTLVDALARKLREQQRKVAVLATDPSSERSGGALLGDRIRLSQDKADDGLFFRSVATRGAAGALAHSVFDQLDLLDAFGFGWILIEAVGAGQSEIEVAYASDVLLVVSAPESGDAVQAMKAGLTEAGDVFCISKADLPGSERAATTLRAVLELDAADDPQQVPPVVLVAALEGRGVDELVRRLEERGDRLRQSGEGERRRRARLTRRVRHLALREIERRLKADEAMHAGADAAPHRLARELLDRLLR